MEHLYDLPEDCISSIICLTSPPDALTLSLVSSIFRSVAELDCVWDAFLPCDWQHIATKSVTPLKFSSKRDLFICLCNSILIDDGNKSFALDKVTGKKSYVMSAKELSILYGDELTHWNWKAIPESRFAEVAELKTICRLEIEGKLKTGDLSPNTTYGAYLLMKISDRSFGLDSIPSESFALEKSSGKKSYIISAGELSLLYGEEPDHWTWKSVPESRFSKVAELKVICKLEVKAKLRTSMLSANTNYGIYFIMKITDRAFGLSSVPVETSVEVGNQKDVHTATLDHRKDEKDLPEGKQRYERVPYKREDGWMEIELGEFLSSGEDEEVTVSLKEVKGCHVKSGLVIEGVEVRPKH